MLLLEKYSPKKIDDLVGNESAKEKIKKWMLDWKRKKIRKPILIYGPTGTGKTSFAYALKEEFDLELIEMNASQFRDKKRVDKVMENAMLAGTLSGRKKIILIDDVDILGRNDRGGASEISRLIKQANVPIILTAQDAWNRKISAIRMQCESIQLRRITKNSIFKFLKNISKEENLEIDEKEIMKIADNANGDLRSAINDLQTMRSNNRDQKKDIFNIVRGIFKGERYWEIKNIMSRDVDYNLVKLWVDENIPFEYHEKKDLAKAYYFMSRSDQFEGRIKNQRWGYLRYVIDFSTVGVGLSKSKNNSRFVKYNFPKYLKEMAATVRKRAMLKSIGKKIGKKTHTNLRNGLEYLDIICEKLKKDKENVGEYYKFSDDEIKFILKNGNKK